MAERFADIADRLSRALFRPDISGNEATRRFRIAARLVGLAIGGLLIYLIWRNDISVSRYY